MRALGAIYSKNLSLTSLVGMVIVVVSCSALLLYAGALLEPEDTQPFGRFGIVLLAFSVASLILSVLFMRKHKWEKTALSVCLHLVIAVVLIAAGTGISQFSQPFDRMVTLAFSFLVCGISGIGILLLHSKQMRAEFEEKADSQSVD